MARRIFTFDPTIPARTPIATPVRLPLTLPVVEVLSIGWRVPPGPSGLMGWAVAMSGTSIIPENAGQWIITDNEADRWDLTDYPTSGDWSLVGYNLDVFDHTVYLRFLTDLASPGDTGIAVPPPLVGLSGSITVPPLVTP